MLLLDKSTSHAHKHAALSLTYYNHLKLYESNLCKKLLSEAEISVMKQHITLLIVSIFIIGSIALLIVTQHTTVANANAHKVLQATVNPTNTANPLSTPTIDLELTKLAKDKLRQEVNQLKIQNDRSWPAYLWNNISISTIALALTAFFGIWKYYGDQEEERSKRAEERFQKLVEDLQSEKLDAKIGSAVVLRTFLQPEYKTFYKVIFDLAVANLRLSRNSQLAAALDKPKSSNLLNRAFTILHIKYHAPDDACTSEPSTSLSQALTILFTESYSLLRKQEDKQHPLASLKKLYLHILNKNTYHTYQSFQSFIKNTKFNASNIILDNETILFANFKKSWLLQAKLRHINVEFVIFDEANPKGADFQHAKLLFTYFNAADLTNAIFKDSTLQDVEFNSKRTDLTNVDFTNADITDAKIENAKILEQINLKGAIDTNTPDHIENIKRKALSLI